MSRFPTYPADILSRADALLASKYGTDKPVDPLLVEIACEAMMMERERCAAEGYRVCAETRHVTLGDAVAKAIRGQQQ